MKPILLIGEGETGLPVALLAKAAGFPGGARTRQDVRQFRQSCPDAFAIAQEMDHVNLFEEWPGRQGNGSAFPLEPARAAAEELLASLEVEAAHGTAPRVVLLAGKSVGRAFGLVGGGHYFGTAAVREDPRCPPFYVVPHPGGSSTWWNDRDNRAKCYAWLEVLAWSIRGRSLLAC